MIGGQLTAGKDQVSAQNLPRAQGVNQAAAALHKNVHDINFPGKQDSKTTDFLLGPNQAEPLSVFLNLPVRQNAVCDDLLREIGKQLRLFQSFQQHLHERILHLMKINIIISKVCCYSNILFFF